MLHAYRCIWAPCQGQVGSKSTDRMELAPNATPVGGGEEGKAACCYSCCNLGSLVALLHFQIKECRQMAQHILFRSSNNNKGLL